MIRQPLTFEELSEEEFPIEQLANDLPFPVFVVSELANVLMANEAWYKLDVVDRGNESTVKAEILNLARESVRNPETSRTQFMVSLPRRISNKLSGGYSAMNIAKVSQRDANGGLKYVINLLEREEADGDFWDTQEMLAVVEENISAPSHFYWRVYKDAETGARMMSYVSSLVHQSSSVSKFDATLPYNSMCRSHGGPVMDEAEFYRGMKRILEGADTGGFIVRVSDGAASKTAFQVHGKIVDDGSDLIAKGIATRTPYYIDLEKCRESIARLRSVNTFMSNAFVQVNEILARVQSAADILGVPEAFSEQDRADSIASIHDSVKQAGDLTSTMSSMLAHEMKRSVKSEASHQRQQTTWITRKFTRFIETHLNEAGEGIPINVIDELDQDYKVQIGSQTFNVILLNLLVNATNAIQARTALEGPDYSGRIRLYIQTVESTPPLKRVRVSFEDNGNGMDPGTLEAFQGADARGFSMAGGGLSTVEESVQEAGGSMRISSVPGKGTKVIMEFPALPRVERPDAGDWAPGSKAKLAS